MNEQTTASREILSCSSLAVTLAGGSRKTVLLDRPWQQPMLIAPDVCPFELREDDLTKTKCTFDDAEGWRWRARVNDATPYRYHRLIIPPHCMSTDDLWKLGGREKIYAALATAHKTIDQECPAPDLFFYVHVGYTAGQRYGHLHWHLNTPEGKPGEIWHSRGEPDHPLFIFGNDRISVTAGGIRAGQCLVVPKFGCDLNLFEAADRICLAETLEHLIALCNEKFKSTQGLPPDYEVCLVLKKGLCKWATYVPFLNFMGGSEHLAMMTGTAYCLPWPHQVTAQHLRS